MSKSVSDRRRCKDGLGYRQAYFGEPGVKQKIIPILDACRVARCQSSSNVSRVCDAKHSQPNSASDLCQRGRDCIKARLLIDTRDNVPPESSSSSAFSEDTEFKCVARH